MSRFGQLIHGVKRVWDFIVASMVSAVFGMFAVFAIVCLLCLLSYVWYIQGAWVLPRVLKILTRPKGKGHLAREHKNYTTLVFEKHFLTVSSSMKGVKTAPNMFYLHT